MLVYLTSDEGKAELKAIGGLSPQTVGVILRELTAFQAKGAEPFFGETEFNALDLIRSTPDGRGMVSLLELPGVASQPELFSTFLMWLVAELFERLPEVGDVDRPKLVFFFDEAHLLFTGASKAFLSAITQAVRLIRSKGVGIFFVTQTPEGRARRRSGAARQPGSARAARLHPRRRQGAEGDGVDVPEVAVRPGRGAAESRHRRGGRDRAVRERRADSGGLDPAARPGIADG